VQIRLGHGRIGGIICPHPRGNGAIACATFILETATTSPAFRDQEWVTAAEIADKAMRDKRLSDKDIRAIFIANFLVRLGQLRRRGKLEKASGRGGSVRWKLAGA